MRALAPERRSSIHLSEKLLDPGKARVAYDNVLRHNPLNPHALVQLGKQRQSQQQYKQVFSDAPRRCTVVAVSTVDAPRRQSTTTRKQLTTLAGKY